MEEASELVGRDIIERFESFLEIQEVRREVSNPARKLHVLGYLPQVPDTTLEGGGAASSTKNIPFTLQQLPTTHPQKWFRSPPDFWLDVRPKNCNRMCGLICCALKQEGHSFVWSTHVHQRRSPLNGPINMHEAQFLCSTHAMQHCGLGTLIC